MGSGSSASGWGVWLMRMGGVWVVSRKVSFLILTLAFCSVPSPAEADNCRDHVPGELMLSYEYLRPNAARIRGRNIKRKLNSALDEIIRGYQIQLDRGRERGRRVLHSKLVDRMRRANLTESEVRRENVAKRLSQAAADSERSERLVGLLQNRDRSKLSQRIVLHLAPTESACSLSKRIEADKGRLAEANIRIVSALPNYIFKTTGRQLSCAESGPRPGFPYQCFDDPEFDGPIGFAEPPDYRSTQWALERIRAREAWSITEGRPRDAILENRPFDPFYESRFIDVAVLDTGMYIDDSPALLDSQFERHPGEINLWWARDYYSPVTNSWTFRYDYPIYHLSGIDDDGNGYIDDSIGYDFLEEWYGNKEGYRDRNNQVYFDNGPHDENGHGTAVSSIISSGNRSWGIDGVCPDCRVISVRVCTAIGDCTSSALAKGIRYAIDAGADIINFSVAAPYQPESEEIGTAPVLGKERANLPFEAELREALDLGVIVVAAAGSTASNIKKYPAAYPGVIAVGGTDRNDNRASFSDYGSWIDIAAPAVDISVVTAGTAMLRYVDLELEDSYYTPQPGIWDSVTGNSYAAPFVSGAVGLLLAEYPNDSAASIKQRLLESGREISELESQFGNDSIRMLDTYEALVYEPEASPTPTPTGTPRKGSPPGFSVPTATASPTAIPIPTATATPIPIPTSIPTATPTAVPTKITEQELDDPESELPEDPIEIVEPVEDQTVKRTFALKLSLNVPSNQIRSISFRVNRLRRKRFPRGKVVAAGALIRRRIRTKRLPTGRNRLRIRVVLTDGSRFNKTIYVTKS